MRARAPVVGHGGHGGHGGHETLVVLSRGEAMARMLRLERLRVGISPVLLQLPWGLSTPAMPGIPLPAKITMQVGAPMPWSHLDPQDADDPLVVARCHDEIRDPMQATLTSLAAQHPRPLLSRLRRSRGTRQ